MPLDSIVIGIPAGGNPYAAARKLEGLIDGRLVLIRHGPIRPEAQQLKEWRNTTGKALPKNATFAALLYHRRGQTIPLKQSARSGLLEVHFHGLQQYEKKSQTLNDGALQRGAILLETLEAWPEPVAAIQADLCLDFQQSRAGYLQSNIHKQLRQKRTPQSKAASIYYQSKENRYCRIVAYGKAQKNGLAYPLFRVEFSFMRQFFNRCELVLPLEVFDLIEAKTTPTIQKLIGPFAG